MRMDTVWMVKNEDEPYNVLDMKYSRMPLEGIKPTGSPKPYITVVYYILCFRREVREDI